MLSTASERIMAKRNDASVKMDSAVVDRCKIAASIQGKALAVFLSEVAGEAAEKVIAEFREKDVASSKPAKAAKG